MIRAACLLALCGCGGVIAPSTQDGGADAVSEASMACSATLLASIEAPGDVALGATTVFVTSSGYVLAMAKDGSSPAKLFTDAPHPAAVAVGQSRVYSTNLTDLRVTVVPPQVGPDTVIWTFSGKPTGLATWEDKAYAGYEGGIVAVSAQLQAIDLVINVSPRDVAADGVTVFWTDANGNVAMKPIYAGVTTPLATSSAPERIAIDATRVYWSDPVDKTISSVSKLGGKVTTIADSLDDPFDVATDGTFVYWSERAGGRVAKAPVGGGPVTVLCAGLDHPGALAVDGADVYFATSSAVYRIAK